MEEAWAAPYRPGLNPDFVRAVREKRAHRAAQERRVKIPDLERRDRQAEKARERRLREEEADRRRRSHEFRARMERLQQQECSEVVSILVAKYAKVEHRADITPQRIIMEFAHASGFPVEEIVGHRRSRLLSAARFAAIRAVANSRPDMSLPQLARLFGNRDHTTILHALRRTAVEGKHHRTGQVLAA